MTTVSSRSPSSILRATWTIEGLFLKARWMILWASSSDKKQRPRDESGDRSVVKTRRRETTADRSERRARRRPCYCRVGAGHPARPEIGRTALSGGCSTTPASFNSRLLHPYHHPHHHPYHTTTFSPQLRSVLLKLSVFKYMLGMTAHAHRYPGRREVAPRRMRTVRTSWTSPKQKMFPLISISPSSKARMASQNILYARLPSHGLLRERTFSVFVLGMWTPFSTV